MFTHLVFPSIRRKMKRGSGLRFLGLLAFILASSLAWGQSTNPLPPNGANSIPWGQNPRPLPTKLKNATKMPATLPHLYWHFLNYQYKLDTYAAERALQGEDATVLRNHLQKRLGFADADYAKVRAASQRLQSELKVLNDQAFTIINAARAANGLQAGAPLRQPVPPEIKVLDQQHEALIQSEVANLKSNLGPKLSAQMDRFLQAQLICNAPKEKVSTRPNPAEIKQHIFQAMEQKKEAQQ